MKVKQGYLWSIVYVLTCENSWFGFCMFVVLFVCLFVCLSARFFCWFVCLLACIESKKQKVGSKQSTLIGLPGSELCRASTFAKEERPRDGSKLPRFQNLGEGLSRAAAEVKTCIFYV